VALFDVPHLGRQIAATTVSRSSRALNIEVQPGVLSSTDEVIE